MGRSLLHWPSFFVWCWPYRRTPRAAAIMPAMAEGFAAELARYGPEQHYTPVPRSIAQVYCSKLARSHYENFTVASVLLPRYLLRHFHNVYAYCRWADDLADETRNGSEA